MSTMFRCCSRITSRDKETVKNNRIINQFWEFGKQDSTGHISFYFQKNILRRLNGIEYGLSHSPATKTALTFIGFLIFMWMLRFSHIDSSLVKYKAPVRPLYNSNGLKITLFYLFQHILLALCLIYF